MLGGYMIHNLKHTLSLFELNLLSLIFISIIFINLIQKKKKVAPLLVHTDCNKFPVHLARHILKSDEIERTVQT